MNPFLIAGLAIGALILVTQPAHAAQAARKLKMPAGARPEIVEASARTWASVFDVPVTWIRSQAYAESRNVPTAENARTGALGVLQILPSTAAWLVASLMKSKFSKNKRVANVLKTKWTGKKEDLFDIELNVMLATYYMLILERKFGHNHEIVAAAYNAGPNKVARLLAEGHALPRESRAYLAMVADAKNRGFM
jgi:soluble lytic murein transglycosylase-like protein